MPRLEQDKATFFGECLDFHRSRPEVSSNQHVLVKRLDLGAWILDRSRAYLDLCWWIRLRDAELGRPRDSRHRLLLNYLRMAVQSGNLLCPIAESVYLELLKQGDLAARAAAVRLIDELSGGVTILDSRTRVRVEMLHFLYESLTKKTVPGPPVAKVWTKVGQVFGVAYPVNPELPDQEQLAIAKAFTDFMWSLSLDDMLYETETPADIDGPMLRQSVEWIAAKWVAQAGQMKSFRQVFLAEVAGFVDAYGDALGGAFEYVVGLMSSGSPAVTIKERQQAREQAGNMIYNLFRYDKMGTGLPTIRLLAGLYAINRWQRRPFSVQDYYDIEHASAAVPYCNFFLTDRHLATVLSRNPLRYDRMFNASVISDIQAALDAFEPFTA